MTFLAWGMGAIVQWFEQSLVYLVGNWDED